MHSYSGDTDVKRMCFHCTDYRIPAVVLDTRVLCLRCAVRSPDPLIKQLGLNAVTNVIEYAEIKEERSQGKKRTNQSGEKLHLKDFILEEILLPGGDRLSVKRITQRIEELGFSSKGGDTHSEVYVSQVLKALHGKGLLGREWESIDRAFRYFAPNC
jgi:hypothetical protein